VRKAALLRCRRRGLRPSTVRHFDEAPRFAKASSFAEATEDKPQGRHRGQDNTDLALTLFKPADFITKKTDNTNANKMYEKPAAVKKLKSPG
jgi:hypothetical protein